MVLAHHRLQGCGAGHGVGCGPHLGSIVVVVTVGRVDGYVSYCGFGCGRGFDRGRSHGFRCGRG